MKNDFLRKPCQERLAIVGCTITGCTETRDVEVSRDERGVAIDSAPVPGSDRVGLNLLLPNGDTIKAIVNCDDFAQCVLPLLARPVG